MRMIKLLLQMGVSDACRLLLLVTSAFSARITTALKRALLTVEVHREGLVNLEIKPVIDLQAPNINLSASDPIAATLETEEFGIASKYFAENAAAARSLVSPQTQALLYCTIRALRPQHVFEIGTYRAGTTEAICRALHTNGFGMAHAVDPFCAEHIKAVFRKWPPELLNRVTLYPTDSMDFFKTMERNGVHPALVFVDGNHDYEFALFDIGSAARAMVPGGFIFVDNIAQVGPFFAGRDFLAANSSWKELGSSVLSYNRNKAYDRERTTIPNTDLMVLQGPLHYEVDNRPRNFGLVRWLQNTVSGVRLKLESMNQPAELVVQIVFRGFGATLAETMAETTVNVPPGISEPLITLISPVRLSGQYAYFSVEAWLIWHGAKALRLLQLPEPF
jgi:predicted O-methyltransferase YrrM